jgi:acyl carrier protein
MNRDHIEVKLRHFIDQSLMRGQGSDLTSRTPLFEFGILDSFALFRVINFIAKEFDVRLLLETLKTEDFENIASISELVQSKLLAQPGEEVINAL